jgi:hypothetical protein
VRKKADKIRSQIVEARRLTPSSTPPRRTRETQLLILAMEVMKLTRESGLLRGWGVSSEGMDVLVGLSIV